MMKYRLIVLHILVLSILDIFIYYNIIDNYFLSEWGYLLKQASKVDSKGISVLVEPMSGEYVRPVTNIYYYLQWKFFHLKSMGYFFTTFTLQLINVWLYYFVLLLVQTLFEKQNMAQLWICFLSALFFASFYPYYEAIYYTPAEILAAFFSFLCMISFVLFLHSKKVLYMVLCVILYAASIFSKENFLLLPVVLLCFSWAYKIFKEQPAEDRYKSLYKEAFLFCLSGCFLIALYLWMGLRHHSGFKNLQHFSLGLHLVKNTIGFYFVMFVTAFRRQEIDMLQSFPVVRNTIIFFQCLFVVSLAGMAFVFSLTWLRHKGIKEKLMRIFNRGFLYVFIISNVWIFVTILLLSFFNKGLASRWHYFPAAGFCFLFAKLVVESSKAMHALKEYLGIIFLVSLCFSTVSLNCIFLYLKEAEYDWHSSVMRYALYNIIQLTGSTEDALVYLVDMPWYVNKDGLRDLLSIETKIKIVWTTEEKLRQNNNILIVPEKHAFFLKFENKAFHDRTDYYRNLFRQR